MMRRTYIRAMARMVCRIGATASARRSSLPTSPRSRTSTAHSTRYGKAVSETGVKYFLVSSGTLKGYIKSQYSQNYSPWGWRR